MVSYPQLPPLYKLFCGSHYWIFIKLVPRIDIYHMNTHIKKVAITEYLSDWSPDSIYIMNIHISRKVGSKDISLLEIEVVLYLESMMSACIPVYTLCTYIWAILNCRQGTSLKFTTGNPSKYLLHFWLIHLTNNIYLTNK